MKSYTVLCVLLPVVVLSLCHAESHSARLTAFGKAPTNNNNGVQKKNTLGRMRECNEDTDCAGIQNTTCMSDPRDGKRRCLCRDSSAPMNGACPNMPRAVRATCTSDSQCVERSECKMPVNATTLEKMCLCKDGFVEDDGWCSGAFRLAAPWYLMVAVFLLISLNQLNSE